MTVAVENGNTSTAECLVREGAQEPAAWRQPRVSDTADFLTFKPVPENIGLWLRSQLQMQPEFIVRPEQMLLRVAELPFYDNVYLVAAEDPNRRGPREQFALCRPGEDLIMLDWKNEPVYSANDKWGVDLADDQIARIYCRFFFHFVRGQLGRFVIVENIDEVSWTGAPSDETRQSVSEKLIPLHLTDRIGDDQIRLRASVIFKNALFHTGILVATRATKILDAEGNEEVFTIGQLKFLDEDLLLENLPVEIDGPPGVFG